MSINPNWVIDTAGGTVGGAARFLRELDDYLAEDVSGHISTVGRGRYLTPRWIAEREWQCRTSPNRIAVNNVSFLAGTNRTVLLRNALHFATSAEMESVNFAPSAAFRAQIEVVRATARRASRVVVPCTAMKERVLAYVPGVEDRIEVRFHPVTARELPQTPIPGRILAPMVPSPYKNLDQHAQRLLRVLDRHGIDATLVFTATAEDLPRAAQDSRVELIGIISADQLETEWAKASAVYFPTVLESFGYPLAEARVRGRRIISVDHAQSREIAAQALAGYESNSDDSLADAVQDALITHHEPDPMPFDRTAYFDWLTTDCN